MPLIDGDFTVYKLYKANKALMTKIIIVVFLYSILIGTVGLMLLGVVINFDTQSFSPQLYDINAVQSSSNASVLNKGLICSVYNSIDCPWSLYDDIIASRTSYHFQTLLQDIQSRLEQSNLNLLQEIDNNRTFLTDAVVKIGSGSFTDPFTFDTAIGQTLNNKNGSTDLCITIDTGGGCTPTLSPQPLFQYIPNLYEFSNSTNNLFLGSQVLLLNNSDTGLPQILCSDINSNCYFQMNNPFDWSYYGSDNLYSNYTNIPAYQAIILPTDQVSVTGNLNLADPSSINIVCISDNNACSNSNISPNLGYFLFLDDSNNVRFGLISLNVLGSRNNIAIDTLSSQSHLICNQSASSNVNMYLNGSTPLNCNLIGTTVDYKIIQSPLLNSIDYSAKTNPKLFFKIANDHIYIMMGLLIPPNQAHLQTFSILVNIFANPTFFIHTLLSNTLFIEILIVGIFFLLTNIVLGYFLVISKLWKRLGGYIAPKSALILRGRLGRILEITQFFQFGGSWYLEAQGVYDYNFNTTLGVVHQLVNERWRDTIFFPTTLAASISMFFITSYTQPTSILTLFIIGGLLPLILAFWTPTLWTIQDSGLKRADWSSKGELLTIQKLSSVIRDGFNKLIGFSAIFGIGTAGASVARANILGNSIVSSKVVTSGLENLINFNVNFLVSAVLWTISLLCIVTSVSLTGNVIASLSYLNNDHLTNVKNFRTSLLSQEVFLGSTQQAVDITNSDTTIYYDSDKGMEGSMLKATSRGRIKPMPINSVIEQKNISSSELTKIIITSIKDELSADINNNIENQPSRPNSLVQKALNESEQEKKANEKDNK